jgi:O-antigen/teichoic acid export membrane protein
MFCQKLRSFLVDQNQSALRMVLCQRVWQGISGLATVFILTNYLSPIEQGWYYAFLSLASFYIIFDFGLSNALIQITSHLFLNQKWLDQGKIKGNKSQKISHLAYQLLKLYLFLFLIFIIVMIPFGFWFFGDKVDPSILNWHTPWIAMVVASGLVMLTLPFTAIYEGSGKVKTVYKIRLIQGILASMISWVFIINGFGLWAPSIFFFTSAAVFVFWFIKNNSIFINQIFLRRPTKVNWVKQIWPLHWRVGMTWVSTYFFTQTLVPILFYTQNTKIAGQMGLSLTVANMLGLLAQSWIAYQTPDMSKAVASKNWRLLDDIFKRNFFISTFVYIASGLLTVFLYLLFSSTVYIYRLLPLPSFVGLLLIVLLNHIIGCFIMQLRSYKQEPLAKFLFFATIVSLPLMIYCTSSYSEIGLVSATLSIQVIFILPTTLILWKKYNYLWRL